MNAEKLLKERRSIRKFSQEIVNRETMKEIIDLTRFAPSWSNFQVARYTLVDDQQTIRDIATEGVNGFVYNIGTLQNAKGVAVLSYVKGKSGKKGEDKYVTSKESSWEIFDAGIAAHQFCLSAYAKGVGTVIMGIIDDVAISKIVNLPKDETVAALIVYGYEDGNHPAPTPRKSVEEISRFI